MNPAYIAHLSLGPFGGRTDPWAEHAHYFSQLHSGIIANLLAQLWQPLLESGYHASKEASLQISELRKPDIAIRQLNSQPAAAPAMTLDYAAAANAILAEPGDVIDLDEPEYQAIYISERHSNRLVTVVEIISPRNKLNWQDIWRYQSGRADLFLSQGVNVVEVDLTRSVKRLLDHDLTHRAAYHMAVFLPDESPRVIRMEYGEPLKWCALPLRDKVIGINLQQAYEVAYREATIAPQLIDEERYTLEHLPFPTLLSDAQRAAALEAVRNWREALAKLSG